MSVLDCCRPCATVQTVNVPGPEGLESADGLNGVNAFTQTTVDFIIPAQGDVVTAAVASSIWMVIGQVVIVGVGVSGLGNGPAHFQVSSLPGSTSVGLEFLNYTGDLASGVTIGAGSTVSPSGMIGP
jgi:hypothetical protein